MVCLGNKQRSFCCFWDYIQVLHFGLFCWLWWLFIVWFLYGNMYKQSFMPLENGWKIKDGIKAQRTFLFLFLLEKTHPRARDFNFLLFWDTKANVCNPEGAGGLLAPEVPVCLFLAPKFHGAWALSPRFLLLHRVGIQVGWVFFAAWVLAACSFPCPVGCPLGHETASLGRVSGGHGRGLTVQHDVIAIATTWAFLPFSLPCSSPLPPRFLQMAEGLPFLFFSVLQNNSTVCRDFLSLVCCLNSILKI